MARKKYSSRSGIIIEAVVEYFESRGKPKDK
jgi:hypothetical protein